MEILILDQLIFIILFILISFLGYFFIFKKANESGIKAFIPIYNSYIECKIVFNNGWLFLLYLIPGVNFIFVIYKNYTLAKVFGYGELGRILTVIFPIIMTLIIGLSSAEYQFPFNNNKNNIEYI